MSDPSIRTEGLAKRYGKNHALHPLDLSADAGSCLALLGHNGAGKTTLIKLLLGLIAPSAGTASVLGAAPGAAASKARIGFLPENIAFNGAMTGREMLNLCAQLKREPITAVDDLLDQVGLGDAGRRKIRTYSKGMRQRLGLAQALLGRPRLLLLDEPTSGLDPLLRQTFYQTIDALKQDGACVLLSSHVLTELEAFADRIAILSAGSLVAHDTLSALSAKARLPIRLRVRAKPEAADAVAAQFGGRRVNGCNVDLVCEASGKLDLLRKLTSLPLAIDDVELAPPSLNEVYAHYAGRGGQV